MYLIWIVVTNAIVTRDLLITSNVYAVERVEALKMNVKVKEEIPYDLIGLAIFLALGIGQPLIENGFQFTFIDNPGIGASYAILLIVPLYSIVRRRQRSGKFRLMQGS